MFLPFLASNGGSLLYNQVKIEKILVFALFEKWWSGFFSGQTIDSCWHLLIENPHIYAKRFNWRPKTRVSQVYFEKMKVNIKNWKLTFLSKTTSYSYLPLNLTYSGLRSQFGSFNTNMRVFNQKVPARVNFLTRLPLFK